MLISLVNFINNIAHLDGEGISLPGNDVKVTERSHHQVTMATWVTCRQHVGSHDMCPTDQVSLQTFVSVIQYI